MILPTLVFPGGSIIAQLNSCLTGFDLSVLQIKTKMVSCHTANSKPVKQGVNGTVILPLVVPDLAHTTSWLSPPLPPTFVPFNLAQFEEMYKG